MLGPHRVESQRLEKERGRKKEKESVGGRYDNVITTARLASHFQIFPKLTTRGNTIIQAKLGKSVRRRMMVSEEREIQLAGSVPMVRNFLIFKDSFQQMPFALSLVYSERE